MHVSVYVFASHDSLGNRDSADERTEGRQVQITGVWKCVQTMLHMLCLSQYYHYLLMVQINPFGPIPSHSTTGSQISCKDFLVSLPLLGVLKFFSPGSIPLLGSPEQREYIWKHYENFTVLLIPKAN
jgi:hypothetical protein